MSTNTISDEVETKLGNPLILEKIDKLFACNVGHHIDLPQLVVVGDQSSGKSSVLQGLTNLPFPRDSGLCTRFATQITFRRAPEKRFSVRIIPSQKSTPEHAQKLRAWSKLDIIDLDQENFSKILAEVHTIMGIQSKDLNSGKTFSADVLHLEVAGPDQQHLSVVDVPGIFKKTNKGVTTKDDMMMVQTMVETYVKNPRSIILAVVPANVDTATQSILDLAEEHDPTGQRTLGVLTKPDLVDQGAEQSVLDLLEGKTHKLALGWCLIRNLGQRESENDEDRHLKESQFFSATAPWNGLDKDKIGIQALELRLRDLLTTLTRREFPAVRTELNKQLKSMRASLDALGPSRDKMEEQAKYLMTIASRFQTFASAAVTANYVDDIFDHHGELRIATLVVNRFESFADYFRTHAHTYSFESPMISSADINNGLTTPPNTPPKKLTKGPRIDKPGGACTRHQADHPDIGDLLHENTALALPIDSVTSPWLEYVYRNSKGFELGTFDPVLLNTTIKAQSEKWPSLSLGYVSDVVVLVHKFLVKLLEVLCPEESIRAGLTNILMDKLVAQYKRSLDQVNFVLQVERLETPTTSNRYFNDVLGQCRQKRAQRAMAMRSYMDDHHGEVVRLSDLTKQQTQNDIQHTINDMHDILYAYYEVARNRVIDVLHMQAVEHHLLSSADAPLKILSPSWVASLSPEQLEAIAGEDDHVKRKRRDLEKGIADLEKGKAILM